MKRKNLVIVATLMLSMTAGCAGNTNPAAVQAAPAPVAETTAAETTQEETMAPEVTMTETGEQVQTNQSQIVMETAPGSISMEKAKSIAMDDAGVSGEASSYCAAKLDWEDGRQVYEIDFFLNGVEYEYEILTSDGSILKKKQEGIIYAKRFHYPKKAIEGYTEKQNCPDPVPSFPCHDHPSCWYHIYLSG